MIEAHTFDAWTRPTSRVGHAFRNLTVLGGFAAPLFLWLAGVAWVNVLPLWGQWYVRPQADYTLFTVFPWVGFLFAGAAVGVLLAAARNARDEGRLQLALGGVGALFVAGGFYAASLPSVYHP